MESIGERRNKSVNVIVDIKGGYGNQLFCYALGYAVSKRLQAQLWLDTSMLQHHIVKNRQAEILHLDIAYDKLITYPYDGRLLYRKLGINRFCKRNAIGWNTAVYKEKQLIQYDPDVFGIKKDTYFDGFWQNPDYFDQYREELLPLLQPKEKKKEGVIALKEEMQREESVSVHIRRGDYVGLAWNLPMSYYDMAMIKMEECLGATLHYYIFSDDMDFAREYYKTSGRQITFISYDSPSPVRDDMYLMSRCRHNIIANSSYSWWGAYQNQNPEKYVICPKIGMWDEKFYLKDWHKIAITEK